MAFAKAIRNSKSAKPPAIDNLNDDCLRLVFEQVYLTHPRKLLTLSRVSRKFYGFAVPWIYRKIKLNLCKAQHLLLLRRLVRQGSHLPTYIRMLRVEASNQMELSTITDLMALFTLLTNIETIEWEGIANVPSRILNTLSKFPSATITIHATRIASPLASILGSSRWLTLRPLVSHPVASSQLTEFCFKPTDVEQFYDGFKQDLVRMVTNNPALTKLWIKPPAPVRMPFPEMTNEFRRGQLPRLRILKMMSCYVELFTVTELSIWGNRDGWNDLEMLATRTDHLSAFIRRIPKLKSLALRSSGPSDMDELEEFLDTSGPIFTLPGLRRFVYWNAFRVHIPNTNIQNNRDVIPFRLLRLMPELTALNVSYGFFVGQLSTMPAAFKSPTADEVRNIRQHCPGLQCLTLDTVVTDRWPFDLLNELARFERPLDLKLELHFSSGDTARSFVNYRNCRHAYEYMMAIRKSIQLPVVLKSSSDGTESKFRVEFSVIKPYRDEMQAVWNIPKFEFRLNSFGFISKKDRFTGLNVWPSFEEVSDDELEKMKKQKEMKLLAGLPLVVVKPRWWLQEMLLWERMHDQAKRRKFNASAIKHFGEICTLYDRAE